MNGEADAELVDGTNDEAKLDVGARARHGLEVIEIETCVAGGEGIGAAVVDICACHALGVVRLLSEAYIVDTDA